jgi:hypothetical protein
MILALVILSLPCEVAQPLPKWATVEVRSAWAKSVTLSDYRKAVQKLKFESDVVDVMAVRKLYDEAFRNWREYKSTKAAFELLCLAAYFPTTSSTPFTTQEMNDIMRCLYAAGDYSNIEYAFVAACAFLEDHRGKLDLELLAIFRERAGSDPLLAALSYNLPGSYMGYLPAHSQCVETIQAFSTKFPLRDEYWLALLMKASISLWNRTDHLEEHRVATLKYAGAVLAHPQSDRLSKQSAESIIKRVSGG